MPNDRPTPPYVLSIDAGTEAIKAGLFDLQGRRVEVGVRNYPTRFPAPAWAEQDPADWWIGLVGAVRDCLAAANVPAAEILAIAVEAGQVSTGSILAWFKRNFGHGAAADAAAQGLSGYQLLDREAAAAPIGSGGLIVLDYFQGNRTPHTDSAARGMIWGLSLGADRGHIFRALMEGIAYGLQDILLTLARHEFDLGRIIASGGATQSQLFMQIYADVLGKPITVTREAEASLLGSAVVAAVGAGAYPDLHAASQAMVQVSHEYYPDPARHAEYKFFVHAYQETYQQMKGLMHNMERQLAQAKG